MIMAIRPELVGDYRATSLVEQGNSFLPGYRAWTMQDRSEPGHIGWPHLATAEKGDSLFRSFATDVSNWLVRIADWNGSSWEG
jgi:creatinine amidohydrolase